jgi:hypothetical protein
MQLTQAEVGRALSQECFQGEGVATIASSNQGLDIHMILHYIYSFTLSIL